MEFDPTSIDEVLAQILDQDAQAKTSFEHDYLVESLNKGQYYRDALAMAIQKGIEIPEALTPHVQALADPTETFENIEMAIFDESLRPAIDPFYSLMLAKSNCQLLGSGFLNDPLLTDERDQLVAELLSREDIAQDQKSKYIELIDDFLGEYMSPFTLTTSETLSIPAMAELEFIRKQDELKALRHHNYQAMKFARRCAHDNLVKLYGEHDDMSGLVLRLSKTAESIIKVDMSDDEERRQYINEVIEVWQEVWDGDPIGKKVGSAGIHASINTMLTILTMSGYDPNLS